MSRGLGDVYKRQYDHGQNIYDAYVQNGTVMLGNQAIFTPVSGDISAEEAVVILNRIK